jgi:hypothetical protein
MDDPDKSEMDNFIARTVTLQRAFLDISEQDMWLMTAEQRHKFRQVVKAIYSFAKEMESHPAVVHTNGQ